MANEKQVEFLKLEIFDWNIWREENPSVEIDLRGADLYQVDLTYTDLSEANLSEANLGEVLLIYAYLSEHLGGE